MLLFIHRKDLRIEDLPAFDYIRQQDRPSLHLLIIDPFLLRRERHLEHSGINFLLHAARLQEQYAAAGRQLHLLYGDPEATVGRLLEALPIDEVVWHEDYTPYAIIRDRGLHSAAGARGIRVTALPELPLSDLQDFQQLSGRSEPYKVFTPFYRRWRTYLSERYRPASSVHVRDLVTLPLPEELARPCRLPAEIEAAMAAAPSGRLLPEPGEALQTFLDERLAGYVDGRDRYAREVTSRISRHLNTGALSVRHVYERLAAAGHGMEAWLRQLAWRDFYLYQSRLNPEYYTYEQRYDLSLLDSAHLQAWAEGRTGIPVIDAAMTQLNATGWMPNRLRMITAMFLTKNLLCPFPYGERIFRLKLSDYDNALNRGGWLWSASLGYDAAPYFRIMNPVTQSQRYDPSGAYIRRWLPGLAGLSDREIHLPQPHAIVDLAASRARAIEVYKQILHTSSQTAAAAESSRED